MDINMTTTTQTITNNLVDIHSHIIYDVDDGSKSIEESINELKELKKIGVKKIICTPHICGARIERIKKIKENFLNLKKQADEIGIELYIGNEILISHNTVSLLEQKRLCPLNRTKYLLVEFKRNEDRDFEEIISSIESIMDLGYRVVLAHPEFYINYRKLDYIKRLKELGVILQLDAISVLKGKVSRKIYNFSKKLLKGNYIDVIASDNHCDSKRNYKIFYKSYKVIYKKYGCDYANDLFINNPNNILEDK